MRYAQQLQSSLERLDQNLLKLNRMVKANKNGEAIYFMEQGDLKDNYEELQNLINISQVGNLGARGTSQTGTF